MLRLLPGLALAAFLAACNATDGTQVAASGEEASGADDAALTALEPEAGAADETAPTVEAGATDETAAAGGTEGTEVAALTTPPVEATPQVDQLANTYLNCVVGRAAQEAEAGRPDDQAVELGVDSCRNQFREARWAYLDTGVSESEADRYGVNLLTLVRDKAHEFLQSGA